MYLCILVYMFVLAEFFFFNDTATTEIYTLSLHDALPISRRPPGRPPSRGRAARRRRREGRRRRGRRGRPPGPPDRKSKRLNSSHANISYAVFCLKKKKKRTKISNTVLPDNED